MLPMKTSPCLECRKTIGNQNLEQTDLGPGLISLCSWSVISTALLACLATQNLQAIKTHYDCATSLALVYR